MPLEKILKHSCFLLATCMALPAAAGTFSVTPVRIFMSPRDRATAVTVTNDGDDELVMQADVYTWNQKASGEDDLALSEDLILSPPILKIAPHSRQVVRLAMVSPPKGGGQHTYRMIVREIPEAHPADKQVQVQVALAFSLPVFITPPGLKRDLACSARRASADAVTVTCRNNGPVYAQPREFALRGNSGNALVSRDSAAYILPGHERSIELRRADGPIPGGALKLAVSFDDGTAHDYDVTLAD